MTKLEMEAKFKKLLIQKGEHEEVSELKMKVLETERERDELARRLSRVIGKVGEEREQEIASVETVRRRQIEKSYAELALDMEERVRRLQCEVRQERVLKKKLMKSLENLVGLVEGEEERTAEQRHNIRVLRAILEGRSYSF